MRTEQLEYVAAVTRLGSLRRAAEELRLPQPALSEALRNLEREVTRHQATADDHDRPSALGLRPSGGG